MEVFEVLNLPGNDLSGVSTSMSFSISSSLNVSIDVLNLVV